MNVYDTIIFDLGAVLIDWNPRYVYRKMFVTEDAMEYFLSEICTSHWNEQQDAGRPFAEATQILTAQYPHYTREIAAYYGKWVEMLAGPIMPSVEMFTKLKESKKYKIVALTNWSAESFPIALEMYDFLHWFDGILVSGDENLKKPDPAIFELLLDRYDIDRSKAVFIDDNLKNFEAATQLGIKSIHFLNPNQCRKDLSTILEIDLS
jgi:2-haloacid dehalogenase